MSDKSNAGRLCDLVMKGGITSGVIYPKAVCELSNHYHFKNIGGTSAGAIAAAAAAAAECGRRNGKGTAFAGLATLPDWIGEAGRLVKMFKPDRATQSLFELAMTAMKPRNKVLKTLAVATQLIRHFPLSALLVAAAAALVRFLLLDGLHGVVLIYAFTATILLALVVFLAVVAGFLVRQIRKTVPENLYGISRAYDASVPVEKDGVKAEGPLTNWLTHYLNGLAGKPLAEGPLTFGDLYTAARTVSDPEPDGPDYRAIRLEMMTTALNHGRPYRLPFRDPDKVFYFCPDDFEKLFPPEVVLHMIGHAMESEGPPPFATGCSRLYRFPDDVDLPVVVATRMSLSFPVLLAAVPLYAIDFTLKENSDRTKPRRADRCWFSDGGISSNLPIHFFDSALPVWPAFAINLKQFHPDHQEEAAAVWLPNNPNSGWLPLWTRFEEPGKFGPLTDFLGAIVNVMQNWQDNTQARVPGYRDRMVHVSQHDNEGGLNLDMPKATVDNLADRGARAGKKLVERFIDGSGWTEHRWVRFRSCMDLTEDWIREIAETYPNALPPDRTLDQLLVHPEGDPPHVYRLTGEDSQRAKAAMDALLKLSADWNQDRTGFQSAPPRPAPELRVKARI